MILFADRRMCEHHLKGLGLSKTCTFRRTTTVGTSAPEATRTYFVCENEIKESSETYYLALLETTIFLPQWRAPTLELLMTLIIRTEMMSVPIFRFIEREF